MSKSQLRHANAASGLSGRTAFLLLRACVLLALLAALSSQGRAQQNGRGMTPPGLAPGAPAGSYSLSGFENVNLFNGNLNFNLPLLKVGGRGRVGTSINLAVNSVKWDMSFRPANATTSGLFPWRLRGMDEDEVHTFDFNIYTACVDVNVEGVPPSCELYIDNNPNGGAGMPPMELPMVPQTSGYVFFPIAQPDWVKWDFLAPGYGPGVVRGSRSEAWEQYLYPSPSDPRHNDPHNHKSQTLYRMKFVEPDGTEHELIDTYTGGRPTFHSYAPEDDVKRGRVFVSTDGSAMTFVASAEVTDNSGDPSGELLFPDGTRCHVAGGLIKSVRDPDGNYVTYSYGSDPTHLEAVGRVVEIKDTLGRRVTITYGDLTNVWYDEIKYNGVGGELNRSIKVWHSRLADALRSDQSLKTTGELFPGTSRIGNLPTRQYNPVVTSAVELPDHRQYHLRYNSYGAMALVELPTGAAIKYNYADPVVKLSGVMLRVKERLASPDGVNWEQSQYFTPEYTVGGSNTTEGWGTVVRVDTHDMKNGGDRLVSRERHYFHGHPLLSVAPQLFYPGALEGRQYQVEQLNTDGSEERVLRRERMEWRQRETPTWWQSFTNSTYQLTPANAPPRDPRVVTTTTSIEPYAGGANLVSKQTSVDPSDPSGNTVGFDQFNNCTDLWEYDFGANGQAGPLLRHTYTKYVRTLNVGGAEYDYACATAAACGQTLGGDGVIRFNGDPQSVIHIRSLPEYAEARAPAGGSGEVVVSRSVFKYDEPAYTGDDGYGTLPADFPGWAAPLNPVRGHLTTTMTWLDTLGSYSDEENAYLKAHTRYDRFGNAVKAWDARGNASEVKFSDVYRYELATQTVSADPDGEAGPLTPLTIFNSYDSSTGLLSSTTNANGQLTQLLYEAGPDKLDRLERVTPPQGGSEVVNEYGDESGNLFLKVKKQLSEDVWDEGVTFFDNLGRPTVKRSSDAVGEISSEISYDGLGRISKSSSPHRTGEAQHWVETTYDALGRVKDVTSPKVANETAPAKVSGEYEAAVAGAQIGLAYTGVNQAGNKARSITNALNQLVRVDEPDDSGNLGPIDNPSRPTYYKYDAAGNLRQVTQGQQSRYFLYDSLGRLIRVRQPEQDVNPALAMNDPLTNNSGWTAGLTYDSNGNVVSATDAKGDVTTYEYDALNRIVKRSYSTPQTTDPKRVTYATSTVTFKYDGALSPSPNNPNPPLVPLAKGALTEVSNGVSTTQFTGFDNLGRITASQQIVDGQVYPFGYKYQLPGALNLSGAMMEETYPSGRVVTNTLDGSGDLSSVSSRLPNQAAKVYASDFRRTANGEVDQLKLGNGRWETYLFNARDQVTQIGLGTSANDASLWRVNYDYGRLKQDGTVDVSKNDGNVLRQTINVPGVAAPYVQTYSYDPLNRLTGAEEASDGQQIWKQTYAYDRYGNRTGFSQVIGQTQLALNNKNNPVVDPLTNRLQAGQGYEYDLNGNLIQDADGRKFDFDGDNKQRAVKDQNGNVIATYSYDGSGRRVKKTVVATQEVTVFVYDANGSLAAEYSNVQAQNPATRYITADILDSPRVITDGAGAVTARQDYMPFGEESYAGRSSDQKYGYGTGVRQGFTGYEKDDETQLDFAEARYYNPQHGRFTAVDPLLASGKSTNPQSFNRYAYAGNNPTLRVDPNGEDWFVSRRPKLYGWATGEKVVYQWKRGNEAVRSHVVQANSGNFTGWVALNPWENEAMSFDTKEKAIAQIEVYRRQALTDFLVGAAEANSLIIEWSGALSGTGVNKNSEMYKLGHNIGFIYSGVQSVSGVGLASVLLSKVPSVGKEAIALSRELKVIQKLCFVAGTPVHTDRGLRAIEKIKVGDKVLSWNESGKRFEYKTVVRTLAREARQLVSVRIAGERTPIVGTPEHPFYVRAHRALDGLGAGEGGDGAEGVWVAAGELRPGDELLRADGSWAEVEGVEGEWRTEAVYNFEVEDNHDYFVGERGALVHNNCDVATLLTNHYGKLQSILARRGAQFGFAGSIGRAEVEAFAKMIAGHVDSASEVWRASYRGSDRLFHIEGNVVVVTQLNGTFESVWEATAAQLAHYRTGTRIR